nr:hypothetical protein [Phycisphaerae bacterium]
MGADGAKPDRVSTALAVDAAQKSAAVGRNVPRRIDPASDGEILAAYEKRATWIEAVLATQAKLEAFNHLRPLTARLLQDYPEAAQEIGDEFAGTGLYHSKQSGTFAELARRYAGQLGGAEREALEKRAGGVMGVAELEPFRQAFRVARQQALQVATLKYFNPEALGRAIRAFASQYPQSYPDSSALLARVEALKPTVDQAQKGGDAAVKVAAAQQLAALYDAVYLKHPAVDFKEILFVQRASGSVHSGLPQNWQGNSSVPLHGYINAVVRAPLRQGAQPPQTVYASTCFVGDVDLDYDARKIMYSCGRPDERGWRVFETALTAPGTAREVTPPDQPDVDFYDPCYLPDGRRLFVATSGYQGVPCVGGADYVGNLHSMDPDGSIRRLVFDQDNSWCPTALVNGRILYLRWEYTDSAHYFSRVLMSM